MTDIVPLSNGNQLPRVPLATPRPPGIETGC